MPLRSIHRNLHASCWCIKTFIACIFNWFDVSQEHCANILSMMQLFPASAFYNKFRTGMRLYTHIWITTYERSCSETHTSLATYEWMNLNVERVSAGPLKEQHCFLVCIKFKVRSNRWLIADSSFNFKLWRKRQNNYRK